MPPIEGARIRTAGRRLVKQAPPQLIDF